MFWKVKKTPDSFSKSVLLCSYSPLARRGCCSPLVTSTSSIAAMKLLGLCPLRMINMTFVWPVSLSEKSSHHHFLLLCLLLPLILSCSSSLHVALTCVSDSWASHKSLGKHALTNATDPFALTLTGSPQRSIASRCFSSVNTSLINHVRQQVASQRNQEMSPRGQQNYGINPS